MPETYCDGDPLSLVAAFGFGPTRRFDRPITMNYYTMTGACLDDHRHIRADRNPS
jgi:hypothetical protein